MTSKGEIKATMELKFRDINDLSKKLERNGFYLESLEFKYSTVDLVDDASEEVKVAYGETKRCGEEIIVRDTESLEKITLEFNPSEIKGTMSHENGNNYRIYINVREDYAKIYDDVRDKAEEIISEYVVLEN
jgi:hypothetical protein